MCAGVEAHTTHLVGAGFYESKEQFAAMHVWGTGYGSNPHARILITKHERPSTAPEHECAFTWSETMPQQTLLHHDYLRAYAYNVLLRFPGGQHCGPGVWGFVEHPKKHNDQWRAGRQPHASTVPEKLRGKPGSAKWCTQNGPMFLVLDWCANVWYSHCAVTQRNQEGCASVLIQFTTVPSNYHVCADGVSCRWKSLAEKALAQVQCSKDFFAGGTNVVGPSDAN